MPMLTESKAFRGFSVDGIQKAKEFYGHTLGLKVSESNGLLSDPQTFSYFMAEAVQADLVGAVIRRDIGRFCY